MKTINLDRTEKIWINFCKCNYVDIPSYIELEKTYLEKHPENLKNKDAAINRMKPLFESIYGWSPDEFYNDYLNGMFKILLDIFIKIKLESSIQNWQLHSIFKACWEDSDDSSIIEKAILAVHSQIRNTTVIEKGFQRFNLTI